MSPSRRSGDRLSCSPKQWPSLMSTCYHNTLIWKAMDITSRWSQKNRTSAIGIYIWTKLEYFFCVLRPCYLTEVMVRPFAWCCERKYQSSESGRAPSGPLCTTPTVWASQRTWPLKGNLGSHPAGFERTALIKQRGPWMNSRRFRSWIIGVLMKTRIIALNRWYQEQWYQRIMPRSVWF